MTTIFTNKPVNNKRQVELDLAKGLALFFMVWVHTNEYYQGTAFEGGVYNRVVEFLGSPPAAPIFMFLLGLGVVYSRQNTPDKLAKRGISLFISGYVLSFCRDVIPYLIMYKMEPDKELLTEAWNLLWGTDILQFAGLAFLFLALVQKYKYSEKTLFFIWCVFASLNMILRELTITNEFAKIFFGLFWGTYDYSWFPFLNWITFPMLGYVFGKHLLYCRDKKALYQRIFAISAMISIPLWIYSYINNVQFGAFGELWQEAYYHHDIIGSFVLSAFTFFWISMFYFITPYIPEFLKKMMIRWSKYVTNIYCIHYTILGFSLLVLSEASYKPIVVVMFTFVSLAMSELICTFYFKFKKRK